MSSEWVQMLNRLPCVWVYVLERLACLEIYMMWQQNRLARVRVNLLMMVQKWLSSIWVNNGLPSVGINDRLPCEGIEECVTWNGLSCDRIYKTLRWNHVGVNPSKTGIPLLLLVEVEVLRVLKKPLLVKYICLLLALVLLCICLSCQFILCLDLSFE